MQLKSFRVSGKVRDLDRETEHGGLAVAEGVFALEALHLSLDLYYVAGVGGQGLEVEGKSGFHLFQILGAVQTHSGA